jgi:hypothetical protein
MTSEAFVSTDLSQPHFRLRQPYGPDAGPELAEALSILTGTKSARRPCFYNPKEQIIFFPDSVITKDGPDQIMSHSGRYPNQFRRGTTIQAEAWAISAGHKASGLPESDMVRLADDSGNVTECSGTIGKISSYKGQTCMELYDKKKQQTYAYVVPSGNPETVVTETMKGKGDGGWSVTSLRNGCGTLVRAKPSADAQDDGTVSGSG